MRVAQIVVAAITVAVIVKVGFGAAFLVIVGLAAFYVIVAIAMPVVIRSTMRVEEKPALRAVELDDTSMPENARVQLRGQHAAFVNIGFEAHGIIQLPAGAAPQTYLALYGHPGQAVRGLSRVVLKPGRGWPAVHGTDVELEIRYDDGTSVELSNIGSAVPGLGLVPGLVGQMPHIRDVARLFDYFLKLAARHESTTGLSSPARVPLPGGTTATSEYYEALQKSYGIQHRGGLLESAGVPGVWRPTWRMALQLAAAAISPGLEFVKLRLHARGERLQRDLDGDATRTAAERIGSRIGTTMLGFGLALSVLGVVMAPPASSVAFLGMVIAWWVAKRGGRTPGWGAIVLGGSAAVVLLGVPIALSYAYPPGLPASTLPGVMPSLGLYLLPMAMLISGAALMVEGFRAAAT